MNTIYNGAVLNTLVSPSYGSALTAGQHQLNLLISISWETVLCSLPIKPVCGSRMFHFLLEIAVSNAECLSYSWKSSETTQRSDAPYPDQLEANAHSISKQQLGGLCLGFFFFKAEERVQLCWSMAIEILNPFSFISGLFQAYCTVLRSSLVFPVTYYNSKVWCVWVQIAWCFRVVECLNVVVSREVNSVV